MFVLVDLNLSERNAAIASGIFCAFAAVMVVVQPGTFGGFFSIFIIVLGAAGLAAIYASFALGYLVMPMITNFLGVSELLGEGYRIPPAQDAVVKDLGGVYHATMYMCVRFYESATSEGETPMSAAYMELWERAIAGIKFPFKFCLIAYLEDMAKYREDVETKRYMAMDKLSKLRDNPRPDALTVDKYEREIAKYNAMLARLGEGEKPMGCVMYAATTGVGANEGGALAAARRQVAEIRSSIANALNVEIKPLKGEDMKRCLSWEYAVPPERNEFLAGM